MIKNQGNIVLTPEQMAAQKAQKEAEQRALTKEFRKREQDLMIEMGVIQFPIIKMDPITGIIPDSVVLPHLWKEGESYLPPEEKKKDGDKKTETKK